MPRIDAKRLIGDLESRVLEHVADVIRRPVEAVAEEQVARTDVHGQRFHVPPESVLGRAMAGHHGGDYIGQARLCGDESGLSARRART